MALATHIATTLLHRPGRTFWVCPWRKDEARRARALESGCCVGKALGGLLCSAAELGCLAPAFEVLLCSAAAVLFGHGHVM